MLVPRRAASIAIVQFTLREPDLTDPLERRSRRLSIRIVAGKQVRFARTGRNWSAKAHTAPDAGAVMANKVAALTLHARPFRAGHKIAVPLGVRSECCRVS